MDVPASRKNRELDRVQNRLASIKDPVQFTPNDEYLTKIKSAAKAGNVPRCGFFGSITDSALQRLAYAANCSRIGTDVYPSLRSCLSNFLSRACLNADILADHRGKTNITALDVLYGLKAMDVHVHGSGKPVRRRGMPRWDPAHYPAATEDIFNQDVTFQSYDIFNPEIYDAHAPETAERMLSGLSYVLQGQDPPAGSDMATILDPHFSWSAQPITPSRFIKLMKLGRSLITARRGATLVGFMCIRPWNPRLADLANMHHAYGLDPARSIFEATPAVWDAWVKNPSLRLLDDANRHLELFYESVDSQLDFDAIKARNRRTIARHAHGASSKWPSSNYAIFVGNAADDDPDPTPCYIHMETTASIMHSVKKNRHWKPAGPPAPTVQEWATNLGLNIPACAQPPETRFAIHILDYACRTYHDTAGVTGNAGQLVNFVTFNQFIDDALVHATSAWRQKLPADSTTTTVDSTGITPTQDIQGGLIMICPRQRANLILDPACPDRFIRVKVHTKPDGDHILPLDREHVILWRPVKLPTSWVPT